MWICCYQIIHFSVFHRNIKSRLNRLINIITVSIGEKDPLCIFIDLLGIEKGEVLSTRETNINIIEKGMEKLGLPMDRTFTNLHKYGNKAGASVPIAMHEAFEEMKIVEGDLVVTVAFGGGLAWGANLIQF